MSITENIRIEVKRGGLAQYFIYMAILIVVGIVNSLFRIPPPYLYYFYMVVGVTSVMSITRLQDWVFAKPIIKADHEGIWTKKLNSVPWSEVKDIRLERTSSFNASNMTSSSLLDLIIETNDGRESVFWGQFINTDPTQLFDRLNDLRKSRLT